MRKAKKILIWGGAVAGIFICLAAGLLLSLPRLVDMDAIGRNALATLQNRYDVRSENVKVLLLPYPHAVIYGLGVTVPEALSASAESVAVYPRLIPLLSGKFRPAEIRLNGPKITVKLPEQAGPDNSEVPDNSGEAAGHPGRESSDKAAAARFARLKDRLVQIEGALSAALPGIVIDVKGGSIELNSEKGRMFWCRDIGSIATILPDRIDLKLSTGESGIWNAFSFVGRIDPRDWKGSGELSISGCAPQDLISCFAPSGALRIGDSRIDLAATLTGTGLRDMRADFTVSVPRLSLEVAGEKTVLKNGALTGSLSVDPERLDIGLSGSRFDYPRLSLTGRFTRNFSDKAATLDLDCLDVDAGAVHDVMLSIMGGNHVVKKIFDIVKGGNVPAISYYSRAGTASELDKLENYRLKGTIERGTILAPKAELLVSDVWGDVVIEDGILYGTELSGKSGGTSTSGGSIKIGLEKEGDVPFHLDLPLKADLADLPPVLDRLVKNEIFRGELAKVKDVKGTTEGRLILGETIEDVKTEVQTGPFRVTGHYGRFPDALDVEGASFTMDGPKVGVRSLKGTSGRTRFSQLDFSYEWDREKVIELKSPAALVLPLNIVEPLIYAREDWKNILKTDEGPLKGTVIFDKLNFKGPVGDRSRWVFNAAGAFEDVTVLTKYFSGPLTLKTGAFEAGKETLTLNRVSASLADSSLLVSGRVNGYFEIPRSADLTASGHLGPIGNKDIAALADLPPTLRGLSDLSLNQSRFSWERDVKTTFEAQMMVSAGPKVGIKVVRTPEEVSIDELVLNDGDSNAAISLKFRKREFKIGFSGTLSNKTADKLLAENSLLTGPIKGKFEALFYIDEPRKSTAAGHISISGFHLPLGKIPLGIENAVLEAVNNQINVKSAKVSWNGSRLNLGGTVTMASNAYLVDMDASADSLDLDSLLDARKDEQAEQEAQPGQFSDARQTKKGWDAPVNGTIRLKSEYLTYGKYTWNSATADVVMTPGVLEVKVSEANLCGLSTPGRVTVTPDVTSISFAPEAKDRDIEPLMSCFFDKKRLIAGKYSLKARLVSNAKKGKTLTEGLEGEIDIKAVKGVIYRFEHFSKIVSLLSITEIYRGHLPDLMTEGCAFDTLRIKGKIKDGKLSLYDSVMDGPSMKMVFRGEVDIARRKMDVVALVSPIRTVDRIIGVMPLVNKVFDAGIVSVPVRISGDVSDPSVVPLSPTAVGEELFGYMKRTFQLPFTIFQPLTVGDGSQGEASNK